jgi:hypothetical protein
MPMHTQYEYVRIYVSTHTYVYVRMHVCTDAYVCVLVNTHLGANLERLEGAV